MKHNIIFLDKYSVDNVDTSAIEKLGDYVEYHYTEVQDIVDRCKGADIIVTNKTPLKRETLSQLPKLKLVCIAATGMNNIDIDAAKEFGIEVRNAVNYSTSSVAESTICGVLSLMKQIAYYDEFVKSGKYASSSYLFDFGRSTCELDGKRWGIIGLGNIGRRVATLAEAFGCEVCYASTSGAIREEKIKCISLEELLKTSDVISIHAPLNDQTRDLISESEFKAMKPNCIIINVARGTIINEQALADALNNGSIAGAYSDVYSREPIKRDNPLLHINDPKRIILTPHSSWSTKEALSRLIECITKNIIDFDKTTQTNDRNL